MKSRLFLAGASSLLALLAAPALAQDCKPAHEFQTVEPGFLTVATTSYAPFSFIDEGGEIRGVDAEIVKKIAEKECLTIKVAPVDPSAGIQYIITKRADLSIGDWYRTAQRASVVGLSAPLYTDQMGIYSKDGYDSVEQLVGKSVGTVQGFMWVSDLKGVFGADLKLYPHSAALSKDLETGRIDVGIDSYATGAYAKGEGGFQGLEVKVSQPDDRVAATVRPAQAGLPYTKDNEALGKAIDENLAAMHADGTIKAILKDNKLDPALADVGEARLVE